MNMVIFRKYIRLGGFKVYECVAELDLERYVLVNINSKVFEAIVIPKEHGSGWKEYVELPKPIVHKRYIHWWKKADGSIYVSIEMQRLNPIGNSTVLITCQEVTHTEFPGKKECSVAPCGCDGSCGHCKRK